MTVTIVKYDNLKDREAKIADFESQAQRMLHDTFDAECQPGAEPSGTMIFTDDTSVDIPEPTRNIANELDVIAAKVAVLEAKIL